VPRLKSLATLVATIGVSGYLAAPQIGTCPDCSEFPICPDCTGTIPPVPDPDEVCPECDVSGAGPATVNLRVDALYVAPDVDAGAWILVAVANPGRTKAGPFYVDLFVNETDRPVVGDLSDLYFQVSSLPAHTWTASWVHTPVPFTTLEVVDAVVDTTKKVKEASESDNVRTYLP